MFKEKILSKLLIKTRSVPVFTKTRSHKNKVCPCLKTDQKNRDRPRIVSICLKRDRPRIILLTATKTRSVPPFHLFSFLSKKISKKTFYNSPFQ